MIPGDVGHPGYGTPRAPGPTRPQDIPALIAAAQREARRGQRKLQPTSATTITFDAGVTETTTDGDSLLSISDLPPGTYLLEGSMEITFDVDSDDQYLRVDLTATGISDKRGTTAGPAPADNPMVATVSTVAVMPSGGGVTLSPTLLNGPGPDHVSSQVSRLRAVRLGPA